MPRFEPLPDRRPAIVAGASSGIGAATAIELAARGFPVALGARRVEKLEDLVGKIRADGGEAVALPPRRHRPQLGQVVRAPAPSTRSATSRSWWPAPGDTYFGKLARDQHRRFRLAAADPPGRRQPAGHRGAARHDRAPARRPDLRRLRRGAAPAPAHGRLRRRQGRAGRHGDQPADGTRGHRGARVDRAPRTDEDRRWAGACPPSRSDPRSRTGPSGVRPGTTTSCAHRISRAPSRSSPRHRAAASSRTWSFSPKRRLPTRRRNVSN